MAVFADTVVVGAIGESSSATGVNGNQNNFDAPSSGAAYVFQRTGAVWAQQAYLKASNTDSNDFFGSAVAISDEIVVVGAFQESSNATGVNGDENNNSAGLAGAAYVFERTGGAWSQKAYLKASNTDESDLFGESVAVSGDTTVVGAFREDSSATGVDGNQADKTAGAAGAAYVFLSPSSPEDAPGAPTLSINGKKRIATKRARIVLSGTSTNATRVELKAGTSGFKSARGTDRWRAPVRLTKKTTVARIRAIGPGGRSPILRVKITRRA